MVHLFIVLNAPLLSFHIPTGFTPLAAGFIAEVNIYVIFVILISISSNILILLTFLSKNVKN